MAIQNMYDKTATTQRQTFVEGSLVKKEFVNALDEFPCHIQPQSAENTAIVPGGFAKQWIMFCDVRDIKEGDKVLDSDDVEYRVAGVEVYTFGVNAHMEVVLAAFRQ